MRDPIYGMASLPMNMINLQWQFQLLETSLTPSLYRQVTTNTVHQR